MLTLAGVADGPAKATKIMALETRIARAHWPAELQQEARMADEGGGDPAGRDPAGRRLRRVVDPIRPGRRCRLAPPAPDIAQRPHRRVMRVAEALGGVVRQLSVARRRHLQSSTRTS